LFHEYVASFSLCPAGLREKEATTEKIFGGHFIKRPAFKVAHIAAGVIPAKVNPNCADFMVQPFIKNHEEHDVPFGLHEGDWVASSVILGRSHICEPGFQGLSPWPPEACFFMNSFSASDK